MKTEPVAIIGAVEALAIAVVALAAYLFEWDAQLTALVVGAVGAAVALLGSIFARSKVSPVEE